jgi:hypothetical protein
MDVQEQIAKNCRHILRVLTKPWEFGKRRLRWYDFDLDAFGEDSSKNLFAEESLDSQEVEDWLYNVIETPLEELRPRLVASDSALNNRRFHRAAVLMLWLQGVRCRSVEADDSRIRLDTLAALPPDQIDGLVHLVMREYSLRLVFTAGRDRFSPPPSSSRRRGLSRSSSAIRET